MAYLLAQKLNRRIRVERKTVARDASGQPLDNWTLVCKLWGEFKVISGSAFINQEFYSGGAEQSRPSASIRVRKRAGLDAGMRVVYQGAIYEIRVILPDLLDNRYMFIGVATGANNG